MQKTFPAVIIMLFFAATAKGQSVQEVQDKILNYCEQVTKWDTSSDRRRYDSVEMINKNLLDYLKAASENNPATLITDFKLPSCGIYILTSDDNRFRIYNWEVSKGGAALSSDVLVQYQAGRRTKTLVENDVSQMPEDVVTSGGYYTALLTVRTKDNSSIYLTIDHAVFARNLGANTITAYTIKNGRLIRDFPFFKTMSKTVGYISFQYDLSIPINEKADFPEIKISNDKRTISIPIITKEDKVTDKYLVYVFDGNNYVYDKNAR